MERYCEQEKNCLRVYVPRELDHHEADRLKQEADFFIETGQVKTLVFDFAGTEFMDSSGIGVSGLHTLIRTSVPKQQKEREGENHNA